MVLEFFNAKSSYLILEKEIVNEFDEEKTGSRKFNPFKQVAMNILVSSFLNKDQRKLTITMTLCYSGSF